MKSKNNKKIFLRGLRNDPVGTIESFYDVGDILDRRSNRALYPLRELQRDNDVYIWVTEIYPEIHISENDLILVGLDAFANNVITSYVLEFMNIPITLSYSNHGVMGNYGQLVIQNDKMPLRSVLERAENRQNIEYESGIMSTVRPSVLYGYLKILFSVLFQAQDQVNFIHGNLTLDSIWTDENSVYLWDFEKASLRTDQYYIYRHNWFHERISIAEENLRGPEGPGGHERSTASTPSWDIYHLIISLTRDPLTSLSMRDPIMAPLWNALWHEPSWHEPRSMDSFMGDDLLVLLRNISINGNIRDIYRSILT